MEVIEDKPGSIQQILKFINNSKSSICICTETKTNFFDITSDIFQNTIKDFITRGGIIKYITEINRENISYCYKIKQFCNLKHLDNLRGNFALNDKGEYIATTIIQKETGIINILYSTSKEFHHRQQLLFERLWIKAIDGQKKIKELEEKNKTTENLVPKTAYRQINQIKL